MTMTLLLVDDDSLLRTRMAKAICERGFRVLDTGCAMEARELAQSEQPERAVLDLRMPGVRGLELLQQMRELSPGTSVVMLTGYGSIATAVDAMRLGAAGYVTKPADADEVLAAFEEDPVAAPVADRLPSLAETEWNYIQRVLLECDGNVSLAADLLEIPRRTLQRKLRKLPP